MKNLFKNLIRSAAFAALVTSTATFALGAESTGSSPANPPAASAPAASARAYPFRGTVGTTDAAAKTVSLAGKNSVRVLHLDAESKLTRDGKDIALAEIQTGDYVKGLVQKSSGHETLVKASVGPKPEPKPRASRSKSTRRPTQGELNSATNN